MSRYIEGREPPCPTCEGRQVIRDRNAKRCLKCARDPLWWEADGVSLTHNYEQHWVAWQRQIGMAREHYSGPSRRKPVSVGRQKILIAGDFHIPFNDATATAEIFVKHGHDTDTFILNGDLVDHYSLSRFVKYEQVDVETEYAAATLFLEQASQTFPKVILTMGNHDKPRFERQLRNYLSEEMVKTVQFLTGGSLDPIAAIASRYANVTMGGVKSKSGHMLPWIHQVGDLLTSHAEKFSRVPASALRGIHEWLNDMDASLNLDPWRVLIQAHTHQVGIFPFSSDKLLIEGGSMCKTMGYQLEARVGGRPQRLAYVTLEQLDGVTDWNSVQIHWVEPLPMMHTPTLKKGASRKKADSTVKISTKSKKTKKTKKSKQ